MGRQETSPDEQVGHSPQAAGGDLAGAQTLRLRAIRLEYFTVAWNCLEALVALVAGWLAASIALEGFGLDSVIETVSGLTVLWRFRRQQADERAEQRAVRVVGITFLALAAYIGYEAGTDLWYRRAPSFSLPGFILAILSLLVMPALGLAKRRTARQLGSRALEADSLETFLCAYLSATLVVGLGLNAWLGWWWADPAAALAMTVFIVREGFEALGDPGGESGIGD